jgi:hypothetical protein
VKTKVVCFKEEITESKATTPPKMSWVKFPVKFSVTQKLTTIEK